jgi:hypothetical protein
MVSATKNLNLGNALNLCKLKIKLSNGKEPLGQMERLKKCSHCGCLYCKIFRTFFSEYL